MDTYDDLVTGDDVERALRDVPDLKKYAPKSDDEDMRGGLIADNESELTVQQRAEWWQTGVARILGALFGGMTIGVIVGAVCATFLPVFRAISRDP